ncbi:hypothetical protein HPDP_00374 [Candidatus Hepatincola sp. Pdp]
MKNVMVKIYRKLLPVAGKYIAKIMFKNMILHYKISKYEQEIIKLKKTLVKMENASMNPSPKR